MERCENKFCSNRDRYYYDVKLSAESGWRQYDTAQDAWYFGVWVNPEKLQTLTFAEGDETRCTYDTAEEYHQALKEMATACDPLPPTAIVVDHNGSITKIYCPRPV